MILIFRCNSMHAQLSPCSYSFSINPLPTHCKWNINGKGLQSFCRFVKQRQKPYTINLGLFSSVSKSRKNIFAIFNSTIVSKSSAHQKYKFDRNWFSFRALVLCVVWGYNKICGMISFAYFVHSVLVIVHYSLHCYCYDEFYKRASFEAWEMTQTLVSGHSDGVNIKKHTIIATILANGSNRWEKWMLIAHIHSSLIFISTCYSQKFCIILSVYSVNLYWLYYRLTYLRS